MRERYSIFFMGYKYFDEGLNGETGKRVDRLCDEKLDDNLAGVFRYPLRIDYSSEEEDVDIPAIGFFEFVILRKKHMSRFKPLLHKLPQYVPFSSTIVLCSVLLFSLRFSPLTGAARRHAPRKWLCGSAIGSISRLLQPDCNGLDQGNLH